MTFRHLFFREIRYRRFGFWLSVAAVAITSAVVMVIMLVLRSFDIETQKIFAAKEAETKEEMFQMQDGYRCDMKLLGFNLLILPEGQQLDDFYAEGYAAKDMPEEYVHRLAESGIVIVRHLLPSIERKIRWPEQGDRKIIVVGTRGEVPLKHRKPKEPIMLAVEPGTVVLGHELWKSLGLKVGDTIRLMDHEFTVADCHEERGSKDDVTLWLDLAEAQKMLKSEGRINGILALRCLCNNSNLASVRKEVAEILPNVSVLEFASESITREEVRHRAARVAKRMLEAEMTHRGQMRQKIENIAVWLVPLAILGAVATITFVSLSNTRLRTVEFATLRAIGFSSSQILRLLLARTVAIGFLGAVLGPVLGLGLCVSLPWIQTSDLGGTAILLPLAALWIAAPLLTAMASMPSIALVMRQDPATVLGKEI